MGARALRERQGRGEHLGGLPDPALLRGSGDRHPADRGPNEPTLGLGEASVGPTGAAIGNAVARALGKRIRDLPLTRERIMATLLAE